ncbi:MAG: YCF48-related protein [Bacteroidota bacterium]
MKTKLFILSVTIFSFFTSQLKSQSWNTLSSGTTNTLIGVSVVNNTICYVSGGAGILLKTTDGGTSWTQQTSGTTQDLYSIKFTDANNGYAVGNNGAAIKTTNGGTTWTNMTTPPITGISFRYVYFINATTGYITGGVPANTTGTILKTTDAGVTWTTLNTNGASTGSIYSVFFTSATVGYANDYDGNIIKTTNAGVTWTVFTTGTSNNFNGRMCFADSSHGFVTGMNGLMYKTVNAGTSWSAASSGTSDPLTGLDFYDSNNGYAVGGNAGANTSKMIRTTDGGATWLPVTLDPGTHRLYSINFISPNLGYAVGLNGTILKYSPCPPNNWTVLTSGTTASLLGVSAVNANICYISGSAGLILKTTNGGNSWIPQTSGTSKDLYEILFTNANRGYAVGNDGAAVKTTNGGVTWTPMTIPTGTTVSLRSVYFVDDTIGYITGGTPPGGTPGNIFKTIDAGNTWASLSVSSVSTNGIYSTYFTSPTIGYANDYDGHILKTTNAGLSWTAYSTGTSNHFNGTMSFTDSVTGYVSGMNGSIYKTNNAGTSWSAVSSGTTDALTGMNFYDQNNGYIVGGDATNNTPKMLKTSNGGVTWTNVTLPGGIARLYKVDFLDGNTAYSVGLNGTILKHSACPPIISLAVSSINTSSNGVCDGSASVSVTSTSGSGYSCLWSTGQTTSFISGLCAGIYTITITDGLGFSAIDSVVITEPADSAFIDSTFILSSVSVNVSTSGYCDGNASVTATGGTPPYSYLWNTGETTTSVSNLCSSVYYITVSDSAGQSISSTIYISEPTDTIIDSIPTPPIDTLNLDPIDSCIVDFSLPIDSAYITSFIITDSMTIIVDWTLWQNGNGYLISTEAAYTYTGTNLLVLTLHCSTLTRELYTTVVKDVVDILPLTTGIDTYKNNTDYKIYPNPFNNNVSIDFILNEKSDLTVNLINSLGQTLYSTNQFFEKGNNQVIVNTENFSSGVYFIQIISKGQTKVSKLIK